MQRRIPYDNPYTPDYHGSTARTSAYTDDPSLPLPRQNTASVNMGFSRDVAMPLEQAMRMRNQGNIGRGPSPQFASSHQGMQRFNSYGEGGQAMPSPTPGMAGHSAGAQPFAAGGTNGVNYKGINARLAGARALKGIDDDAAQHLAQEAMGMMSQGNVPPTGTPPPATQPSGQTATPPPMFGAQQQTTPPASQPFAGKANPPTATLPMSGPAYDQRLRDMRGTAATDLDNNPTLGTTPYQHTPLPGLTPPPSGMGNSPADYRQASGQAYANQSAIARMNQAGDDKVNDANAAQIKQNQAASANLGRRSAQMDATRQPKPATAQPAQAAAPTVQPTQQQPAAQMPPDASHYSASTGTYWKQVNGQWVRA